MIQPSPEARVGTSSGWRPVDVLHFLAMAVQAGPGLAAFAVLVALARALLPLLFVVASGRLVAAITVAAGHGSGSPDGRAALLALVLALGAYVADWMLWQAHNYVTTVLGHRLDLLIADRLMAAALTPASLAHLETPDVAAAAEIALRPPAGPPGYGVRRTLDGVTTIGHGLLMAALVIQFRWWAGLVLLGAYLAAVIQGRLVDFRWATVRQSLDQTFAASNYLRDLSLDSETAKEVRIFGIGDWIGERFVRSMLKVLLPIWRERSRGNVYVGWTLPPLLAANAFALATIAVSGLRGEIDAGRVVALTLAVLGTAQLDEADYSFFHMIWASRPVAGLRRVEAAARTLLESPKGRSAIPPAREIRFEGVWFSYPGAAAPVLRGVDLTIPAGRSLALVGLNGAGKTTLIKLFCGLLRPDRGRIMVDGLDLACVDLPSWQRIMAPVHQDFVRYPLTLAENVTFDGDEGLAEALGQAGAADLAAGPNTPLNPEQVGGADLSGGQWQRVAIARSLHALTRGAAVLVLDEPTAALDVRAEQEVFDRILDVARGRTVVLISHRLSTVRRADRICVLEEGLITERGSHDELMAAGGRYAKLFELQAARFRAGVSEEGEA